MPPSSPRARAVRQLRGAAGSLSTAAMARMETDLPWFPELGAEERSWVGLVVQAGIGRFVDWYRAGGPAAPEGSQMAASVFGAAPRALAGVITLQQTVDLVRLTIEVVEHNIDDILDPAVAADVHAAILRYGREIAFATAEVYARAAEVRGAWDARLEALVVDAVLRGETDESVLSRASAVGWAARGDVAVVLGTVGAGRSEAGVVDAVRRAARAVSLEVLGAVQGHRLVVILGGVTDPEKAATAVVEMFDEGPVVVGPVAPDLGQAHLSARAAQAGLRAAAGWPQAPRPVRSADLLPERILDGDDLARQHVIEEVHRPLAARVPLIETLTAYFDHGGGIEATARALFVHPNTVRYRLGQIADLTGLSPALPRDALALRLALALGRLDDL
ncbi:MAG TPA: helix-turn-helix domain-containing protein [Nocardioides sp.]|nr:helix-turn-helix domain-containing protein [Nocardioides sp.]